MASSINRTRESFIADAGFGMPFDESPIKTPRGWCGGEVRNTGGHVYCRIWTTENTQLDNARLGDEAFQVIYNLHNASVGLDRLTYDPEYEAFTIEKHWYPVEADECRDLELARTAKRVMEFHNGVKRPDTEPVIDP